MRRRVAVATVGSAIVSGCLRLQQDGGDLGSQQESGTGNIRLSEVWTETLLSQTYTSENEIIGNRSSPDGGYLKILNKDGGAQYESDTLGGEYLPFLNSGDSVAIQDNAVFVVGTDMDSSSRLAAFSPDSGDRIWTHDTDSNSPRDYMRYVVADGERVYVAARERYGTGYNDTVIKALSVGNGDIIWEKEYPDDELRGLTVYDSKLFAGFSDALEMFDATTGNTIAETVIDDAANGFVPVDNQVYTIDSEITAHNLNTGDEIWSMQRDKKPDKSTVSNNLLFCGTNDGYLTAHNLNNQSKIWEVKVDHNISTSPAATQSTVFVAHRSGIYSGVDIETGEVVYTNEIDNDPSVWVAALDESIYMSVASREGTFTQRLEIIPV